MSKSMTANQRKEIENKFQGIVDKQAAKSRSRNKVFQKLLEKYPSATSDDKALISSLFKKLGYTVDELILEVAEENLLPASIDEYESIVMDQVEIEVLENHNEWKKDKDENLRDKIKRHIVDVTKDVESEFNKLSKDK